jgi:hypothetical protein
LLPPPGDGRTITASLLPINAAPRQQKRPDCDAYSVRGAIGRAVESLPLRARLGTRQAGDKREKFFEV